MRFKLFFILLSVLLLAIGGCKDDDNPAGPAAGPTVYTGVMAGGGVSGSISISIPTAKRAYPTVAAEGDTIVISGTLKLNGGASITLTGIYIPETGEISLTGGGYSFFGFVDEGEITGSFTYSGGNGFFTASQGSSSNVITICGMYQDNSPGEESGSFNMLINGTELTVIVYPDGSGGEAGILDGTLTDGTQIAIYSPKSASIPIATGTLNTSNNTVSGSYAGGGGGTGGTWSGSPCN